MRDIIVPQKFNSIFFTRELATLYEIFKNATPNEDLNFDLNQLEFTCPFLLLPLFAYLKTTKSKYSINESSKIKSYLDTVQFPNGINSVSEFDAQIQSTKNYIPISVLHREKPAERERLESLFSAMVYKTVEKLDKEIDGIKNVIYYPISELLANIFDHSKKDEGFIFGQYYPNIRTLEICIVDCGRGLAAAYKQEKNLNLTDGDAIIEVMKGNSTKSDKERGYGIRTSKQVVCNALGGEFVLMSGSAALLSSNYADDKERLISLPNFSWDGVVIAYRIPVPEHPVDITPYLE